MKKRVTIFILSILIIMASAVPAFAAFDVDTRESVAVVRVCWEEKITGAEKKDGWGTGFFVGKEGEDPQYLITNYHVIKNYVEGGFGELFKFTDDKSGTSVFIRAKIRAYFDSENYEELYMVEYNKSQDIAVLRLAEPTSLRKPLPLKSPDDSLVGSEVYAVGYPGLSENLFSGATKSFGTKDVTVTSGIISRMFVEEGKGLRQMQIDCEIKPGNSGGPLLDENGNVLGVCRSSVISGDNSQLDYAVYIDDAINLLKRNDIEYEYVSAGTTAVEKTTDDKSETATENTGTTTTDTNNGSAIDFTLYLVIGIGAVVIIGAIAVALILVKKNKRAVTPATPAVESNPAPTPAAPVVNNVKTAYVRSLSMQHNGSRVKLGENQILIGRNKADCAIAFKEGTPGVSGRHCSLSYDSASGDFILTDLRSSYGTFLQNGKKLTPGISHRLRAGDRFYLGDSENLFVLELE